MAEIVIENIREEDLKEIVALGLSTPELHVQPDHPEYYQVSTLKEFIKSPDDIHLVARINGKLAGYRLATFNKYLKEAYLIDMVVKPEYRGQGVASKLYEKTFALLNEKGCVWAWALVKEDNTRMLEVIKKKGFEHGSKFVFCYKVRPF